VRLYAYLASALYIFFLLYYLAEKCIIIGLYCRMNLLVRSAMMDMTLNAAEPA
jgi:hypothetical protein